MLFVMVSLIVVNESKLILVFILSPIKKIKINNIMLQYNINEIKEKYIPDMQENNAFVPIIEINLPFLATSYIYIKYIILFVLYLILPIIIYYAYININILVKKKETTDIKFILIYFAVTTYINYILVHYMIIPFFINFIYTHYNEFLYYEFDTEFQLINYLNLYFKVLYFNFFFFIIINIKKYLHLNIPIQVIIFILIMISPLDLLLQIIYLVILTIFNIVNNVVHNYYCNIKRYKQMECSLKN
jgi:hypothetical protein